MPKKTGTKIPIPGHTVLCTLVLGLAGWWQVTVKY